MSVSIPDLPADVEANYEAQARAQDVSLDAYLSEYLINNAPTMPHDTAMSAGLPEKELNEFFDSFPPVGPRPDEAFSRESVCSREDSW
jgi:hypothetical protein